MIVESELFRAEDVAFALFMPRFDSNYTHRPGVSHHASTRVVRVLNVERLTAYKGWTA